MLQWYGIILVSGSIRIRINKHDIGIILVVSDNDDVSSESGSGMDDAAAYIKFYFCKT